MNELTIAGPPLSPSIQLQMNSTSLPYAVILGRSQREMAAFKALLLAASATALAALWRACARPVLAALGGLA